MPSRQSRPPQHQPSRRRVRSMHGESWHLRKTIGTNISSREYELFVAIAASNGVSVSAYLRAIICDVLVEEAPRVQSALEEQRELMAS